MNVEAFLNSVPSTEKVTASVAVPRNFPVDLNILTDTAPKGHSLDDLKERDDVRAEINFQPKKI